MNTIRSKYTQPDFQFVRFRVGSFEFGIDIKSLKEIVRYREITPVPGAPAFVEGFIRLRGMAVPVIDLRRRFGLPGEGHEPTRIMITSINGHIAGLVVDEVADITTGGKELRLKSAPSLKGAHPWDDCIEAVIESGTRSISIIRLQDLLDEKELGFFDVPVDVDADLASE